MAQDLTAEADSGGHTDNRPALALLPTMLALRDRKQLEHGFAQTLRVGTGGGIATPASAAAAFAMGAAYVVGGSVHQACVESGTSDVARQMLADAQQADTVMAPSADMFEMGVNVQVLKRGTMFAMRAAKLGELYRAYGSLDEIPQRERTWCEKTVFHVPLEEIWNQTRVYFLEHYPSHVAQADKDPKHKMALVFRWYLGQSVRWAQAGDPSRKIDYQIWCGPSMGAFNEWAKGSFLEPAANRRIAAVALNILYGAAVLVRANGLRWQGIALPPEVFHLPPMDPQRIEEYLS
jgi:PfaD family protein